MPELDRSDTPPTLRDCSGPPSTTLTYSQLGFDERSDKLGEGGNAVVYRATVPSEDLTVALKRPSPGETVGPETLERIRGEATRWERVDDHPYIAAVVDWGTAKLPWVAIEYLGGGTLSEREPEMALLQRLWTAYALADAVAYASGSRGVTHHDLKPANVLFREMPGDTWAVPKICDWGLGEQLLQHDGSVSQATPDYAAPEQLDAFAPEMAVGVHTDVYQLGVVCYELLTGDRPLHLTGDVPLPTTVNPELPTAVDDVLMRALAHERGARYEQPVLFKQALADVITSVLGTDRVRPATGTPSHAGEPADEGAAADGEQVSSPDAGDATTLRLTLQDAYDGVTRELSLPRTERCPDCGGSGEVVGAKSARGDSDPPTRTCRTCDGTGTFASEEPVEVDIPAGVRDGQTLGLDGDGISASPDRGDRLVEVVVEPDSRFERDGVDLYYALDGDCGPGDTTHVPTPAGEIPVHIPPDIGDGGTVRLAERGMPHFGTDEYGDLYVRLRERTAERDAEDTGWPMFKGGPARTGYRPGTTGPRGGVVETCGVSLDDSVRSPPVVADGTAYISGAEHVSALDATDGSEQWRCSTDGDTHAIPAVAGGTVYVCTERRLHALDAVTGSEQWRFDTGGWLGSVASSPAVVGGTVYIVDSSHLYAVDAAEGATQWEHSLGFGAHSPPAIAGGTVYVGSSHGHVSAIDSGTTRWRTETGGAVSAPPAVADGTVYVGSDDDAVYALDAGDGSLQWRSAMEGEIRSSPAVADGTVYVGSDDAVYAVDASDGSTQWCFETDGWVRSPPAMADGTVYVRSQDGYLYAADADSGAERWRFSVDGGGSSPVVTDGRLYIASGANRVSALVDVS